MGEVAIVTGAGRGIGRAIALAFAKTGRDVIINDINLESAEKVAEEVKALGQRSLAVKADISNRKEVDQMVKKTMEEFGKIDVLVNNAAIVVFQKTFLETTEEQWEKTLAVNLKGTFNCSQAVAKEMVKRKKGKIINISSECSGRKGGIIKELAPYNASKGGVNALTQTMALELAPYNINCNVVSPQFIETPANIDVFQDPVKRAKIVEFIPLGRPGLPEDIAKAVVFLASDNAEWITGTILTVDGGSTAGVNALKL